MGIGRQVHGSSGFAVVDVETTGFSPRTDRVVEVAVVHLNSDGQITGDFCTLVNPCRDVGATRVHGITTADVAGAPTFAAAAAAVWQMLAGRVLVAHNASFDQRFLEAEFNRCGVRLPPPPVMCTMRMSGQYLPGLRPRTLASCCQAAGVEQSGHHSALGDAYAAARLLAYYRSAHGRLPASWRTTLDRAARTSWAHGPQASGFHPVSRSQQAQPRRPPAARAG